MKFFDKNAKDKNQEKYNINIHNKNQTNQKKISRSLYVML